MPDALVFENCPPAAVQLADAQSRRRALSIAGCGLEKIVSLLDRHLVVTFSWDFNPHSFDEAVIEQAQTNVRSKLSIAGLCNLAVSFQKGVRGGMTIYVSGSEEDVAKAKKILGV